MRVEWYLSTSLNSLPSFQPSEFQPFSLRTTHLSLLSSLLRSTFNPLSPILLYTLPTPPPPANVHASSNVTCLPSSAPVPHTIIALPVPGTRFYRNLGDIRKGAFTVSWIPVQLPAVALPSTPLFQE
ncbi:hypothetical protein K443DRAFT_367555 [Laccaria amethystina LaAM-08-1]|uniref:Uncharacterized protein n=1 Tax=Laccaria amethystina LaAM-08-1 TaxID=1095629 RepID=A0A0C9Y4X0_9AGAR|nr:hypothetical protein K443DRAFT_367555 [Laccaria amethystina LaAM-08-1]